MRIEVDKIYDKVSWGLLLVMCSSFLIYDTSQLSTISVATCCGLLLCIMVLRNRGCIRVPITLFCEFIMGKEWCRISI